jgi:hypothetical protein
MTAFDPKRTLAAVPLKSFGKAKSAGWFPIMIRSFPQRVVKCRDPTRCEQEHDGESSKTDNPAIASPVGGMWLDFVALVGHAVLSG